MLLLLEPLELFFDCWIGLITLVNLVYYWGHQLNLFFHKPVFKLIEVNFVLLLINLFVKGINFLFHHDHVLSFLNKLLQFLHWFQMFFLFGDAKLNSRIVEGCWSFKPFNLLLQFSLHFVNIPFFVWILVDRFVVLSFLFHTGLQKLNIIRIPKNN